MNLGPTVAGDWDGRSWGEHRLMSLQKKPNPCITPKPHFVLKREDCSGKKIWLCFDFKFTTSGNLGNTLYFNVYWNQTYLVSLQMSCAKPYSSYTLALSFWCFILPAFCQLSIFFPAVEGASPLGTGLPLACWGWPPAAGKALPKLLNELIQLLSVKLTKHSILQRTLGFVLIPDEIWVSWERS